MRSSLRILLLIGLGLGLLFGGYGLPTLAQGPPRSAAPAATPPAPLSEHPGPPAPSDHGGAINQLLVGLLVILVGAKLAGELFERAGLPAVSGEILAGIVIGNLALVHVHGMDQLRGNPTLQALSELGVILLLFEVGLESNVHEMRKVGWSSLLVAALGVAAPMGLGWLASRALQPQAPALAHLYLAATLCATSVGITARVLKDLKQLHRPEARIVLGAAVIDDVMGLVVLAVVSGIITAAAGGGSTDGLGIAWVIGKAALFLFGAVALGRIVSPRLFRLASFLSVQHMLLVTSLGFCFLLARLSSAIGLAPIIGAFAAGLILDPVHYQDFRDRGEHTIEELVQPITAFLVPIFFVMTGMSVDLRALSDPGVLALAVGLTAAAVVGKQLCALGVLEKGLDRLSIGVGMIPRGEVDLIFASMGRGLLVAGAAGVREPVISGGTFSAVVLMVMLTTLVTPPLLKWTLTRSAPRSATES